MAAAVDIVLLAFIPWCELAHSCADPPECFLDCLGIVREQPEQGTFSVECNVAVISHADRIEGPMLWPKSSVGWIWFGGHAKPQHPSIACGPGTIAPRIGLVSSFFERDNSHERRTRHCLRAPAGTFASRLQPPSVSRASFAFFSSPCALSWRKGCCPQSSKISG
jgi:hypothetical protein